MFVISKNDVLLLVILLIYLFLEKDQIITNRITKKTRHSYNKIAIINRVKTAYHIVDLQKVRWK